MKSVILLSAIFIFSLPASFSQQYKSIREIEGVKRVVFESPYLFVVIGNRGDRTEIMGSVKRIVNSKTDPDISKIEEPFLVKVCDFPTYDVTMKDLRLQKSITNPRGLRNFIERSHNTSLFTLNWGSGSFSKDHSIVRDTVAYLHPDILKEEEMKMKEILSSLTNKKAKPDRLVVVTYVSIGITVYPVYKNQIKINDQYFPFDNLKLHLRKIE